MIEREACNYNLTFKSRQENKNKDKTITSPNVCVAGTAVDLYHVTLHVGPAEVSVRLAPMFSSTLGLYETTFRDGMLPVVVRTRDRLVTI